jgi:hypothetical protein
MEASNTAPKINTAMAPIMQAPPKPKQTTPRAIFSQPIRHPFQAATKTVRFLSALPRNDIKLCVRHTS